MNQDQLYIQRVINGENHVFSLLVDKYKHMVFTLALRMVKNREEAEEVSQDTFIRVYNSLDKFKGESKFSTWLYRITYNKSLDCLKKQKRTIDSFSVDGYDDMNFPDMENIINGIERKERKIEIAKVLKELSPDDNTLITLFYYEDLSLAEISEVMGISSNTVKVKLFRSRNRLAVLLKEKLEPEFIQGYGKK